MIELLIHPNVKVFRVKDKEDKYDFIKLCFICKDKSTNKELRLLIVPTTLTDIDIEILSEIQCKKRLSYDSNQLNISSMDCFVSMSFKHKNIKLTIQEY